MTAPEVLQCADCGEPFERPNRRGRIPTRCGLCAALAESARQRRKSRRTYARIRAEAEAAGERVTDYSPWYGRDRDGAA